MTTYDFKDGKGLVPAQQNPNGGGWVADTATVAESAFVGPDARVFGNAQVYGYAQVCGNVLVSDNALVSGYSYVSGYAQVYGNAQVSDNARVYGNAQVYGDALVYGDARVYGVARVFKTPVRVSRSDGYDFILVPCSDGKDRVIAGCRYFTLEEAYNHWNKEHEKHKETEGIIKCLQILYANQKSL